MSKNCERLASTAQALISSMALVQFGCSAHTLRHTMAINALKQGMDIYRLSRLLGHTSVITTEIYLRAFRAKNARIGQSVLDSLG